MVLILFVHNIHNRIKNGEFNFFGSPAPKNNLDLGKMFGKIV